MEDNMEEPKPTTSPRREKKQGVLSKIWNQTGNTVGNTGGIVEHTTGLGLDTLTLGRESMKPSIVDARVETLIAVADGIADLVARGVDQKEAQAYITRDIA